MPRKPKEEEAPRGCPEWIVTFSDIISLLVTFFVLILTFSTLELEELNKLSGAMRGGFGFLTPDFTTNRRAIYHKEVLLADRQKDYGADIPFERDLDSLEEDMRDVQIRLAREVELEINRIEGGLRIRIQADQFFDPNSDEVKPEALPMVAALADILGYYNNDMVVEGHTDSSYTGSDRFPTGFELGGSMARRLAALMIEQGSIAPHRVGIASFGATRPVGGNDTPYERSLNRRVEILVKERKKEE
jgi:chemotaxis protein MotB